MDLNRTNRTVNLFELFIRMEMLFVVASVFLYPETTNFVFKQGIRVAFVFTIVLYIVGRKISVNAPYFVWTGLFSVVCLVNCVFAENQDPAFSNLITVIQAIWIAFFLAVWLAESGAYKWLFNSIIACAFIYCVRMLRYMGTIEWGSRKVGFILGTNVNSIGFRLAVACLLSLYLYYKKTIKRNYIYLILSFVFVAFILASGSRRALILCIIAYALFSLSQAKDFVKRLRAYAWIAAILALVYLLINKVPQFYAIIGYRVKAMMIALYSSETILDNGRDQMISTGLNLFLQRPIFGWGMNNFRYVSGIDHAYSHNNYVELLFAMGLPGFVVYYYIVAFCLKAKNAFTKKSLERILCITLLVYCLIADMAAANYTSLLAHLLFAIPISMSLYTHKFGEAGSLENKINADRV